MILQRLPRLQCDLNFGLPVLVVSGFIYSYWASDVLATIIQITGLIFIGDSDAHVSTALQETYYLSSLATSIALYYGFKTNDKNLIQYWHLQKFVDFLLFITAAIIPIFHRFYYNWPYCILSIILLGLGWYLITTIKIGTSEIGLEIEPISSIFEKFKRSHQEKLISTSKEETENSQENPNLPAKIILRIWGLSKILEISIISIGIFLIIINSSYSYWEIFWFVIDIGIFFCLFFAFIWKLIPEKEEQVDNNIENVLQSECLLNE